MTFVNGHGGYICTPHMKETRDLIAHWKESDHIASFYFVTATFSQEGMAYFPEIANHYLLARSWDISRSHDDLKKHGSTGLSFLFSISDFVFERSTERLNYISLYFTKFSYGLEEVGDLARIISKKDRIKKACIVDMQVIASIPPKFIFPYSSNIFALEVEGDNTHQSDQKYCERTRRDVARKGMPLDNLVSFSILEKLK